MKLDPDCPVHGRFLRIGWMRVNLGGGVGWTVEPKCTCATTNRGLIGTAISGGMVKRHPRERADANVK